MRQVWMFALEVLVALGLNLTAGLFIRAQALAISRWVWLIVLAHATFLVLTANPIRQGAAHVNTRLRERCGTMLSYVLVCLVFAAIGAAYWRSLAAVYDRVFHESQTPSVGGGGVLPDSHIDLSITCDSVNLPMQHRGDIWSLDTIFLRGLTKLSPNPLKPAFVWPEKGIQGTGFRCTVKNFGSTPAYGATISLKAVRREVVRANKDHPEAWTSGRVIHEYEPVVAIPQPLGPQGQDSFTFYVCSYDPTSLIDITVPSMATVDADEKRRRQVKLAVSSAFGNPFPVMPNRKIGH